MRLIMSPHISVQTMRFSINIGRTMYGEKNRNNKVTVDLRNEKNSVLSILKYCIIFTIYTHNRVQIQKHKGFIN